MAEPKRIHLDATRTLQREKKAKEVPPTYRFEVNLSESSNNTESIEISYAELLKQARSNDGETKNSANDDPFLLDDDDDDKLQEIAKRFEEKYNPKIGRKKKKKLVISEDYIDKGMGYDETDPFIDNEEAYDELVPSTLTTEYGGFYINKGDLEFKNNSEPESGNDSKPRKKRVRQITDKDNRKKRRIGNEEGQKKRGRKPLNENVSALLKPKKKTQPTVADMLQQHKAQMQLQHHENLQLLQLNPIPVERDLEIDEGVDKTPQVQVVPGQNSTISDAIESVVKAAGEEGSNGSAGPVTGSSDGEEVKAPIENIEAPKLPDNLPPELDDVLAKLKEAAYKSEEGKCKFFSDEVNRMLLSVEMKAQELTSAQRSTIYSHLASHLPCTKETLQKRAKKLRLDQEDGKLREPMQRLKDGIAEVMPGLMEKYAALMEACDAREEERNENASAAVSDADDNSQEGEKKISRLPKKHFEWNDTIRKYLCDVVRIKLKCYEVSKTRIQSAEEYLKHFLDAEVKNLWPPGWMQSRILFRESRAAHFYITSRPKKQILVPKKTTNPLMFSVKPAVSLVNNNFVPQESQFDTFVPDKSVPSVIMPKFIEDALEKRENVDPSNEQRATEFSKLFALPVKCTMPDGYTGPKIPDGLFTQAGTGKLNTEPPKTLSPIANSTQENLPAKSTTAKTEKLPKLTQVHAQSKQILPTVSKIPDFNTFTEGSLASDMLARIICASLADFPYAGSQNNENTCKTTSVISANPALIKESRSANSKFLNDSVTSPKKHEGSKLVNTETRKASQDSPFHNFPNISFESLLNLHQNTRQNDSNSSKNKGLPSEVPFSSVNLKLKDSVVPHSRQFQEAFERTTDSPSLSKKYNTKGHTYTPPLSAPNSSVSSSRLISVSEIINDYPLPSTTSTRSNIESTQKIAYDLASKYPSSPSPRSAIENAQKLAYDLAAKFTVPSQGPAVAPYKKRSKYVANVKNVTEQWNIMDSTSLGSSVLEGMKGFPFPVSPSLPAPPPAHSSSPHRTISLSPHTASRTSSHISPGLRSIHEPKTDSSNPSSQIHSHISVAEAPRRQSLIQGPWKSTPTCQASSTSLSHFLGSTSPPIANPIKTTSPNHHSPNSHVNMSPAPAHSMSQIEKVSSAYNRSHSPLPLRASPSHISTLSHVGKTSPSNNYGQQLVQTSYATHQPSHTVPSPLQQQVGSANSPFDPSNPVVTLNSSTGSFTYNPELKTHPRTN